MSNQPTTVQYLSTEFQDLDKKWIQDLVSQFPTAQIEFLKEQCVQRLSQLFQQNENNNNNQQPSYPNLNNNNNNNNKLNDKPKNAMDKDDQDDQTQFFYPKLNKNDNKNKNNKNGNDSNNNKKDQEIKLDDPPDLPMDQLNFLYSGYIDSDDVC